jgi:hypothetical protein
MGLGQLHPDRDPARIRPERDALDSEPVEELDDVGDEPINVVGRDACGMVALTVTTMVEKDAAVGAQQRLEITGGPPQI